MKTPSKLFVVISVLAVLGLLGAELYARAFSPRKLKPVEYKTESGKTSFASSWKTPQDLDLAATLPVAHLGRVKPLDSVARHGLTVISESQTFIDFDGQKRPALLWLLDLASGSSCADEHRVFKIQNLDLLRKFGLDPRPGDFRYSLAELQPKLEEIEKEYPEISAVKPKRRNAYQNAVMSLSSKISIHYTLRNAFGFVRDPTGIDLAAYKEAASALKSNPDAPFIVPLPGDRHWQLLPLAQVEGISRQKYDPAAEAWFELLTQHQLLRSLDFARHQLFLAGLPEKALAAKDRKAPDTEALASARRLADMLKDLPGTKDAGAAFNAALPRLLEAAAAACKVHQERITKRLAEIDSELPAARAAAEGEGDIAAASEKLTRLRSEKQALGKEADVWIRAPSIVPHEATINRAALNIQCIVWYFIALVIALLGWLVWRPHLRVVALSILWATFALHTATLILRIWISGYPPVTNLYSSAVFIGWVVVLAGIVLEHFWRANAATPVAALAGAMTLLIAQFLSLDGETMKALMPVLDTKFWLATHVVCITKGYGATFFAGGIGALWILIALFDPAGKRTPELDKGFSGAIYGVTCFAMFFSLVGTVLGGLWADDSWGRFWGWDPKENGALLIVIANAILLHCRWSGMVRLRGLAVLALFGNIVTSWSWFGTNLLGAGLHAYGFTESGAFYLSLFIASQLLLMALAPLAREKRSSQS
ncbi:MAG: Cytochrome c biosis protein CcsA [Verrucomicrobiota bacterium]|jgi:ABC-type transport system involved in cytochrome c biogenesis permease subunit